MPRFGQSLSIEWPLRLDFGIWSISIPPCLCLHAQTDLYYYLPDSRHSIIAKLARNIQPHPSRSRDTQSCKSKLHSPHKHSGDSGSTSYYSSDLAQFVRSSNTRPSPDTASYLLTPPGSSTPNVKESCILTYVMQDTISSPCFSRMAWSLIQQPCVHKLRTSRGYFRGGVRPPASVYIHV